MAKQAKAFGFGKTEVVTRFPQPVVQSMPAEEMPELFPEERAPRRMRRHKYIGRHRAPKDHGFGS
jgi:hypothetical protein